MYIFCSFYRRKKDRHTQEVSELVHGSKEAAAKKNKENELQKFMEKRSVFPDSLPENAKRLITTELYKPLRMICGRRDVSRNGRVVDT